jgi:hypothetical protein
MYIEMPNRIRVQIINPTFGVIRNEPLELELELELEDPLEDAARTSGTIT